MTNILECSAKAKNRVAPTLIASNTHIILAFRVYQLNIMQSDSGDWKHYQKWSSMLHSASLYLFHVLQNILFFLELFESERYVTLLRGMYGYELFMHVLWLCQKLVLLMLDPLKDRSSSHFCPKFTILIGYWIRKKH